MIQLVLIHCTLNNFINIYILSLRRCLLFVLFCAGIYFVILFIYYTLCNVWSNCWMSIFDLGKRLIYFFGKDVICINTRLLESTYSGYCDSKQSYYIMNHPGISMPTVRVILLKLHFHSTSARCAKGAEVTIRSFMQIKNVTISQAVGC